MAEPRSPRPEKSKIIIGCLIALVLGVLSPLIDMFAVFLLAVPVLLAFLYAFSGIIPYVLGASTTLFMSFFAYGLAGLGMTACALILPSAVIVRAIHMRAPFHTQLVTAISAFVVGVVAALAIAYAAIGSDIIGALMGYFEREFQATISPGFLDMLLSRLYDIPGSPDSLSTAQMLAGFLTTDQRAKFLAQLLSDMRASLSLTLPGYLLSSAALSGLIAVAWPGHVNRKSVPEGDPSRLPLYQWYTPYGLSLGLLGTMGVAYLLSWQKVSGGDTVYMTMRAILLLCFEVQAVTSAERRLRNFGAKVPTRAVVIILSLVFFSDYAAVYGGVSALFGSTGAVRQLMAKRADKE